MPAWTASCSRSDIPDVHKSAARTCSVQPDGQGRAERRGEMCVLCCAARSGVANEELRGIDIRQLVPELPTAIMLTEADEGGGTAPYRLNYDLRISYTSDADIRHGQVISLTWLGVVLLLWLPAYP